MLRRTGRLTVWSNEVVIIIAEVNSSVVRTTDATTTVRWTSATSPDGFEITDGIFDGADTEGSFYVSFLPYLVAFRPATTPDLSVSI